MRTTRVKFDKYKNKKKLFYVENINLNEQEKETV